MIFGFAVHREDVATADGMHRQRMSLRAVFAKRRAEDGRRIQLMRAEFGHQAAAGAVPQSPATQFFHGGANVTVGDRLCYVSVLLGVDLAVSVPLFPLRNLLVSSCTLAGSVVASSSRLKLLSLSTMRLTSLLLAVDGDNFIGTGNRHRPTVVARQIAAMPLSADVMQLAQQADRIKCTALSYSTL